MRTHRGQVVLFLLMVLVAVMVLVLMNVGSYLAVSARNRTMNAGDAAALAVARMQGELLNRIGRENITHLQAVFDRSHAEGLTPEERRERLEQAREACRAIMDGQRRMCFLGPLDGIRVGNEWAQRNGIRERDEEAEEILRQHVFDIRTGYAMDPEQYPEPWEGAWSEYATALETALGGGLYAAPDNIEFVDAAGGHLLLNAQFYNAIAGRNWCWFHFNAPGVAESYGGFRDWDPLPTAEDGVRRNRCCNSEIHSLHLVARTGSALTLFGKEMLLDLTGYAEQDLRDSVLVNDQDQVWYFYDTSESGLWRTWWEIDPEPNGWNEGRGFPVVGKVKPEFDVRGCAAACRVTKRFLNVVFEDEARTTRWTAAAKPFGTEANEDGAVDAVTARKGLVLPSFKETRLVPWDAVGGSDTERPNLDMVNHIRNHLPRYLAGGVPALAGGCFYCDQLRQWERPEIHAEARQWLKFNSKTCVRPLPGRSGRGGTAHGH